MVGGCKVNIYELTEEIAELDAILEEAGDDADDAIREALEGLQLELSAKIDGLHKYYRNLVARRDGFDAEAKRLKALSDVNAKKAERIKMYLRIVVELQGGKANTEIGALSVVNAGGKQSLIIGDDLPDQWTKEVVTVKPDTDRIREYLENGGEISGAFIAPRGRTLRGA